MLDPEKEEVTPRDVELQQAKNEECEKKVAAAKARLASAQKHAAEVAQMMRAAEDEEATAVNEYNVLMKELNDQRDQWAKVQEAYETHQEAIGRAKRLARKRRHSGSSSGSSSGDQKEGEPSDQEDPGQSSAYKTDGASNKSAVSEDDASVVDLRSDTENDDDDLEEEADSEQEVVGGVPKNPMEDFLSK